MSCTLQTDKCILHHCNHYPKVLAYFMKTFKLAMFLNYYFGVMTLLSVSALTGTNTNYCILTTALPLTSTLMSEPNTGSNVVTHICKVLVHLLLQVKLMPKIGPEI